MKMNFKFSPGRVLLTLAMAFSLSTAGCSKESKIAGHIKRGAEYIAAEEYTKAEIELLNAIRLDPANMSVVRQLGEVYYQQGNIPKAFVFLKKAADEGQTDEKLRIQLGRIYLTGRKMKEARQEATTVLQSNPLSDEALIILSQAAPTTNEMLEVSKQLAMLKPQSEKAAGYHLAVGTLAFRQRDLKGAEASFMKSLEISPKLGVAHEMLANVQFRQNDVAKGGQSLKNAAEFSPLRSVVPLRYADFLKDSGDEAGALKYVEELAGRVPDYIPANVQLAQMLFSAKRHEECGDVLKRVLGMDPSNYEAMLLNARLTLVQGDKAKGLTDMEKVARAHPRVPQAHYSLAVAHLINNDATKALTSLGQAVAIDPDFADALLLQAELNLRKGDVTAVVTSMSELVRERPQLGRAYILLGDAQAARGNSADALNTYSRLIQAFPKNPVGHQLTGGLLARQGRREDARRAFDKARELAPDYYPALEQLVELDIAEKKFADATSRLQAEMQKNPKMGGPHVLLGRVYWAQTNLALAEAEMRKAMELDPNIASAPVMLGQILYQAGREKEALAALRSVSEKNPGDAGVMMQIGMLESQMGNHKGAREAYEQLLKVKPDFAAALNNLAYLYSEHFQMLDEAYEAARKAREIAPNDPIAGDTLGWILFKRREYGWALGMLQASAQKLPNEPEVSYHLGMVQYMMGDEAGARASLTQATSGTKTYVGREDAIQRLQLLNLDFSKADAATLASMEKQLAGNPGDPIISGRLAAIEEGKGNFDKAVALYERTIAANKGNVSALSKAARIYATRLNNPQKALELAKAAREASPENPELAHTLGSIAYSTGDQQWAVSLLEESGRKLGDDPDVLFDLALAQYSVGRVADADSTMQRAIGLGKNFSRMESARRWVTIASLYKDPARLRQSSSALGDWLKAEPNNPAVLMATGMLHELQNNLTAAEQSYTRLLSLHPGFSPASLRLAAILSAKPETLAKALEIATKLRQVQASDPEVARILGIISYKRGDYSRAAVLLTESSRKLSSDAQTWYYLGLSQNQLKQTAETRRALEKFLSIESAGDMAVEARRVLAELK